MNNFYIVACGEKIKLPLTVPVGTSLEMLEYVKSKGYLGDKIKYDKTLNGWLVYSNRPAITLTASEIEVVQ